MNETESCACVMLRDGTKVYLWPAFAEFEHAATPGEREQGFFILRRNSLWSVFFAPGTDISAKMVEVMETIEKLSTARDPAEAGAGQ